MLSDFVAGDTNSTYLKVIIDAGSNQLVDLTGYTVTLRWRNTLTGNMTATRSMVVLNQTTSKGQASYRFAPGELVAPYMWDDVVVTETATGRFVTQLEEVKSTIRAKAA